MLSRSQELQEWIASCASKEVVKQRLRELTLELKSELLKEALNDDRVYFIWTNNLKDVKKEVREWIALEKYCEYDEILGSVKMELSGWNDGNMPSSNLLDSSALFGVKRRTSQRRAFNHDLIFSRGTTTIRYTGSALYQEDWDVLHCLIRLSADSFNVAHVVSAGKLLTMLKMPKTGTYYDKLEDSLVRLAEASIYIKNDPRKGGGDDLPIMAMILGKEAKDLLPDYESGAKKRRIAVGAVLKLIDILIWRRDYDRQTENEIRFVLDSRLVRLFGNHEYGLIDWNQRLELKQNEFAKKLQCYFSGQMANPQYHNIERLRNISGMLCEMKEFIRLLTSALNEMKKVGIISNFSISKAIRGETEKRILTVWK